MPGKYGERQNPSVIEEAEKLLKDPTAGTGVPLPWSEAGGERKLESRYFASWYESLRVRQRGGRWFETEKVPYEKIKEEIKDLSSKVQSLEDEVESCKDSINQLRDDLSDRPVVKETQLLDIDEGFEVLQPIPIVIEEYEDEVIVSFPEIEVFAVADNEPEAISNLKAEIKELYCDLVDTPKNKLGKLPLRWFKILERLIRKVG